MQTPRVIRGFGYEPIVYDRDLGQEFPLTSINGNLFLGSAISYFKNFPDALTQDKTINITYDSLKGTITVDENQLFVVGDRLYNTSDYDIAKRTFTLSPSTTYHLRFSVKGGFYLANLADTNYNPNGLPLRAEWDRPDDFVIADIITDANAVPTIYKRKLDRWEKFKKEIEKLNVVYKELWVDPNGDDRNDGSQEAPFQTIEGALLSLGYTYNSAWGTYEISSHIKFIKLNLTPGVTYDLSKVIALNHLFVRISGNLTNKPKITNAGGGNLRLRSAYFEIWDCAIDNTQGGILIKESGGVGSKVSFSNCDITIGISNLIAYSIHQHFHIALYNSTVIKTSTGLLVNCNGSSLDYFSSNLTIQDGAGNALTDADIIGGIVKDANGVPRNVKSNVIL